MAAIIGPSPGMDTVESAELIAQLESAIHRHQSRPGGLIPLLQEAQAIFGYLPDSILRRIASALHQSFSEVAGVVGFYSFFSRHPCGRHTIRVCLGTACYVRGGQRVLETFQQTLGVNVGDTTADRRYTLEVARCLGACGIAPACLVDKNVHPSIKATDVPVIVHQYG